MRYFTAFAALAATTAFAVPAAAQTAAPRVEVDSRALILQPASIVAGDNLDFGTVLASNVAGSVTVTPGAGALSVVSAGGATAVSGAQAGSFNGNGVPASVVSLVVTSSPTLRHTNGVDSMAFLGNSYGSGPVTIAADGLFRVLVGGRISVAANQAPGQYSGKVYVDAVFP